jgi:guanylate kinase
LNSDKEKAPGLCIIISAPSGAGKTSICRRLLDKWPNLRFSVSHTTRAPRPGEKDGRDYHFISAAVFKEKIARGEFVEWVENYNQFYGTARTAIEPLLDQGFDLIIDVEPRGAKELKINFPAGIFVFILPPSWQELKNRLIKRGCEKEDAMQKRLRQAREESREVIWYDYAIFNDRLGEAVDQLSAIYVAEKTRRKRLMGRINRLFDKE